MIAEIDISQNELAAGEMSDDHLAAALRALDEDGIVALNNVVSFDSLDALHDRMIADVQKLIERADAPHNWIWGNVQQDPPPYREFLFKDVLLNEFVIQVTRAALGRGVTNHYYTGNTNMPGSKLQPVHVDTGQLWEWQREAHPSAQLVVNVSTVEMNPRNGSTEVWPGTHRDLSITRNAPSIVVSDDRLEARRKVRPPFQPTVQRGAAVLRDVRLWHRGTPNRSDHVRTMIAMIHSVGWLDHDELLVFPTDAKSFFDHPVLATAARFTDEPIDYISAPSAYDYNGSGADARPDAG